MIELGLLAALLAVGYLVANQKQEQFVSSTARPTTELRDDVVVTQEDFGHSNEVPFFGSHVTQSMYSGATNHIMDNHTGSGKEYFQKREVKSFYDAKPGTGQPFGNANESDFMQSRMVSSNRMNNVFPIEQTHVGPGVNDGYTNIPKGGYQQDAMREFTLPRTTDELRVVTKPKVSYEPPMIPGANKITVPGIQAEVKKNKPDRFAVIGMDRVNTEVGAQIGSAVYPNQPMKSQAREETSVQYQGPAGGGIVNGSYLRKFIEPFQEFMKLTAEGRPNPAGAQGTGLAIGPDMYSAQTKKDETVLSDAARFNVPVSVVTPGLETMGSYRYTEPLQQDINVARNGAEMLTAFKSNPYAQSLHSY